MKKNLSGLFFFFFCDPPPLLFRTFLPLLRVPHQFIYREKRAYFTHEERERERKETETITSPPSLFPPLRRAAAAPGTP